ncbi:MAG: hypothetical protein L3J43_06885 [Sulfurovum sp.]|nr:hypothetical protein [Sulfurovum sp.]
MLVLIKNKFMSLLQLLLVIIYIIFEELIWEGIAKPIYEAIHSLKILQNIETKLQDVNPSVVLFIFTVLLIIVEAAGIYAGILFVSGQVFLGLVLYISKIPIAAFTFWIFRITEDKLMQFKWFKYLYEKLMQAVDWLKRNNIYIKTIEQLKVLKIRIKENFKVFKGKYLTNKSPFITKVKSLYKIIKATLNK